MRDEFWKPVAVVLAVAFLFLLLGACSSARAQAVSPPCLPFGLAGEATTFAPFVKRTDRGWHMWIYCRDPYVGVSGYGMTCPHGVCLTADVATELARRAINDGPEAVRAALLKAQDPTKNCKRTDLPAQWAALCEELRALIRTSMPNEPPPVWLVATMPAGAATRPAYALVDGQRGAVSGRAAVGSRCDCAVRVVEGRSVYCGVNGRADQVALCRRQP